jgi:exodeoxyribonuclease VII small subunit
MTAKKIDFEKALQELEQIVAELEAGDVSLEEAIKKFKRGCELAKQCRGLLRSVEVKVEEALGEEKGKLKRKSLKQGD